MKILNWKSFRNKGSDIYVITTVVDDSSADPVKCELRSFPNIKKGDGLPIGSPFGVKMYQTSDLVPSYLDIRILVARSKQGIRDTGQAMASITQNESFKGTVQTLSSLVTGPIGLVVGQIDKMIGLIGSILKIKRDDQIYYYAATVSRDFDNLGIGENCDGNSFVEFCYEIQVGRKKE